MQISTRSSATPCPQRSRAQTRFTHPSVKTAARANDTAFLRRGQIDQENQNTLSQLAADRQRQQARRCEGKIQKVAERQNVLTR